MKSMTRDHSFSTHAKFPEKQHFLLPDTHTYVKILFLPKFCVRSKPQCKKNNGKRNKNLRNTLNYKFE